MNISRVDRLSSETVLNRNDTTAIIKRTAFTDNEIIAHYRTALGCGINPRSFILQMADVMGKRKE